MNEEEPAWRAELQTELRMAMLGFSDPFTAAAAHVYAAEQRGRAAGMRAVANHLESIEPIEFALGTVDAVAEACRMAAEAERQ